MTVKCCVSCFVGKTQEQRVSDIKKLCTLSGVALEFQ